MSSTEQEIQESAYIFLVALMIYIACMISFSVTKTEYSQFGGITFFIYVMVFTLFCCLILYKRNRHNSNSNLNVT